MPYTCKRHLNQTITEKVGRRVDKKITKIILNEFDKGESMDSTAKSRWDKDVIRSSFSAGVMSGLALNLLKVSSFIGVQEVEFADEGYTIVITRDDRTEEEEARAKDEREFSKNGEKVH